MPPGQVRRGRAGRAGRGDEAGEGCTTDLGIAGRVALVAGGSQGIGKGIALALAREGVHVAVCARSDEVLRAAAREIAEIGASDVLAVRADVTDAVDVRRLVSQTVARYGRLDILVNAANRSRSAGFFDLTDQDWLDHVDVKLVGKVRLIREAVPHMRRQGWGRIVNLGGESSRNVRGSDGRVFGWTSGAINPGIISLSKRLCDELAPSGITVNTVLPGRVETPGKAARRAAQAAEALGALTAATAAPPAGDPVPPIGRAITAADTAHLVVFIVSELAGALTGQVLCVDGGATAGVYY